MIRYDTARHDTHLQQILQLQQANLPHNITEDEKADQGFVTVEHSLDLIRAMNDPFPHIIATIDDEVIGYALVMLPAFRNEIDILVPMFDRIESLASDMPERLDYFVMGQVCVAKPYRGQGIFYGLYDKMKIEMAPNFHACITEVDPLNPRSLKAHVRQGFELFDRYTDPDGRPWELIIWYLND